MKTSVIFAAFAAVVCFSSGDALAAKKSTLLILSHDDPPFPRHLFYRGITSGSADAIVSVDAVSGRVVDSLICSYTQPEFARQAEEVLRTLVYKPFATGDARQWVRFGLSFNFEASGAVISQTGQDTLDNWLRQTLGDRRIDKMGTPQDLDAKLAATHVVRPGNPPGVPAGGRVVLDFLIDESGRVRMPALDRGGDPALGEAAAAALLEWQFAPATRRGEPVIVRAKQEFVFRPGV